MKKYLYEDLYRLEEDHWWHISKRRAVVNLIKRYAKSRGKILDIGCGTGRNLEEFSKFGKVYGLDNSISALNYCKKRGLKNIKIGGAEKIPFSVGYFDIITLLDVLEHTDDNKTLKEVSRILKKNGVVIMTVPAFSWLWSRWDEVLHHKRRYCMKDLKSILEFNNLSLIYASYLYSFLILPVFIVRKIKNKLFHKNYGSDFRISNPFINQILNLLSRIEFSFAQQTSIPFGTSIVAVAKKNEKS